MTLPHHAKMQLTDKRETYLGRIHSLFSFEGTKNRAQSGPIAQLVRAHA